MNKPHLKSLLNRNHLLPFSLKLTLACALCSCLVQGCGTPPPSEKQLMTVRMGDTKEVDVLDIRSVVRNNLLTAQVTVKNNSETKLYEYRFKWLSSGGIAVLPNESWKPLTISKDQSIDLLGIAPTPDAANFRFEISQYKGGSL